MARNNLIELSVHVHNETDAAILVSDDGIRSHAVWLPKSQLETTAIHVNRDIVIEIPEWLAIDKGLV